MEVHEVVDNSRLKVILYPVDDDLCANINDLAVCHIGFVLVQCLIYALVHLDALPEILCGFLRVLTLVVWAGGLDFEDVAHDYILAVALALDEERLDAFSVTTLLNPTSPSFGAVCSVENRNEIVGGAEPSAHVCDCSFGGGFAQTLAFLVGGVEE